MSSRWKDMDRFNQEPPPLFAGVPPCTPQGMPTTPTPGLFSGVALNRMAAEDGATIPVTGAAVTRQSVNLKPGQILVEFTDDGDGTSKVMVLDGRGAFYMMELIARGPAGLSSVELQAGLRVGDGIFKLRRKGFRIESEPEDHGGAFAGRHARYVLKTRVQIVRSNAIGGAA